MGLEWLNEVLERLTQAGFRAQPGYPGASAVCLSAAAAAVNLTGMDSKLETAKVTVSVLTPRALGLARCQEKAVQALEALHAEGEQWSFSGWQYDEGIDCYRVDVNGVRCFAQEEVPPEEEPEEPPENEPEAEGYQVLIGEEMQEYVTDFLARQQMDRRLIRPHAQAEPIGVTPGMGGWTIKLTQLLPPELAEPVQPEEPFTLTVCRGGHNQVFSGCCWSDYSSQQRAEGTQVIRSGFALSREVT